MGAKIRQFGRGRVSNAIPRKSNGIPASIRTTDSLYDYAMKREPELFQLHPDSVVHRVEGLYAMQRGPFLVESLAFAMGFTRADKSFKMVVHYLSDLAWKHHKYVLYIFGSRKFLFPISFLHESPEALATLIRYQVSLTQTKEFKDLKEVDFLSEEDNW